MNVTPTRRRCLIRAAGRAPGAPLPERTAFTLIELLLGLGVCATLLGLLLPALAWAREAGRTGVCSSNLRQLVGGVNLYAGDFRGYGAPGAPDFLGNLRRWFGARSWASEPFSAEGGTLTAYVGGECAPGRAEGVRACPSFAGVLAALSERRASTGGFERNCGGYGYNNAFLGTLRGRTGTDSQGAPMYTTITDRSGSALSSFLRPSDAIAFTDSALAMPGGVAGGGRGGVIEYSFAEPRFWPDNPGQRADPSIHFRHGRRRLGIAGIGWLDGHASPSPRTFTWTSGIYGASTVDAGTGWTGSADNNDLFAFE